jgi:type I restriction enzyme R subunit
LLTANQNPEQLARDAINKLLSASGRLVQSKKQINLQAAKGVAVREYQTEVGPAFSILFINKELFTLIEDTPDDEGVRLAMHEGQMEEYNKAVAESPDKSFQGRIFKKQAGTTRYTTEQVQWLRMIKDCGSQLVSCRPGRFRTRPFQQARRSRKNVAVIR